jgi:hypothetical protein
LKAERDTGADESIIPGGDREDSGEFPADGRHTFAREARRMLLACRPVLRGADLDFVNCDQGGVAALVHGLTAAATGFLGALKPSKDLAYAQTLIAENSILKGWTCRQIGCGVFVQKINRDRRSRRRVFKPGADKLAERVELEECVWELCPPGRKDAIYHVTAPLHDGSECQDKSRMFFAYQRAHAAAYRELVVEINRFAQADILKNRGRPNTEIDVFNGGTLHMDGMTGWDEIVMNDTVRRCIRDDFLFFTTRESWFRDNRLPFKRGYLLVGPPGNGKTMIARAMASTPGFSAMTFDFTAPHRNDNSDLFMAFEAAAGRAPAVILLEDIDRIFESPGHTQVTKDGLLNCLDGAGIYDGIVVVATANNPEGIDPALLHRPGRFDRVVRIENPDGELRYRQLHHLFSRSVSSRVSEPVLRRVAGESAGFSMADLKEVFVSAGCECYTEQSETILDAHLLKAFETIRQQFSQTARATGF